MAPLLLDLAVLYRALAFGADGDLDPAESDAMRTALEAWAPGEDPAGVDHALREAALVDARRTALEAVLDRVRNRLGASGRAQVLADLRRVARADGRVTQGEEDLIHLIERALGPESAEA
ncbi:TerB family tellurite resistance protein [Rubrivirga marina]|uniref:Co-chaperone DjlA N-terminal domain-containing protein n=1 Tax=Rubrivirga marina TaxID=1196024 RepID=A0A271IWP1_9BACT|nr:TerB family tellurite resistance protein [Rubrivirga marina]PAP75651.1 hypothetical protein BSZ37_03975 [Rubrivirga marina]